MKSGSVEPQDAERVHAPEAAPTVHGPMPVIGQAKLVVGRAHDPQEREADQVADLVVRAMRSSGVKPVEGGARVQRSARARIGAGGGQLDQDTERRIQRARSGGQPLEAGLQRSMGNAIGADLSGVRVHRSAESGELNDRMGARAFTLGNDVFLGSGAPATTSADGLRLVAHEVAHTVQQGASPVRREMSPEAAGAAGAEEAEEPVEMAGVIAKVQTAAAPEDTTGLGQLEEDRTPRSSASGRSSGGVRGRRPGSARVRAVPLAARVSSSTSVAERAEVVAQGDDDEAVGRAITTQTAVGTYGGSAFGSMRTTITVEGAAWELAGGKVMIDCTLKGQLDWGVASGGNIDVPSASAPFITKDNYTAVADDLTPHLEGKSWRAPRRTYWSQALTSRHELFHANDAANWINTQGPGVLKNYLTLNPITLTDDEKKDPAKVKAKVDARLAEGLDEVKNGRVFYFRAGLAQSGYLNFPGEERAFGDGRQPYQDLADGVRARGAALAAAATPAPTAPPAATSTSAATPVPAGAGGGAG